MIFKNDKELQSLVENLVKVVWAICSVRSWAPGKWQHDDQSSSVFNQSPNGEISLTLQFFNKIK